MAEYRYGVSTHLFHEFRLARDHFVQIAAHGFEAVEVFATRSHFDYHDPAAVARLADWLSDTGLALHSVHAPIVEGLRRGQWIGPLSNAASDEARRAAAVAEARAALDIARHIPFRFLVVHLGAPVIVSAGNADNDAAAARRSLEHTAALAAAVGVRVAVEVIPNALSTPEALVRLIEDDLDGLDLGICLDFGHANLLGDVADAIETVSGHLWTTHIHDNHGRQDDHLVPFAGTIDWPAAIVETQKIGYDGVLMLEVAGTGDPAAVLQRSAAARDQLERAFVTF